MNPWRIVTMASSRLSKMGRAQGDSVVCTTQGDDNRDYSTELWGTHGIVSRPSKATRGLRIRIGPLAIVIAAYTYGVDPPDSEGATKLYGTDADGAEQSSILLGADGVVTVNDGEDWAVRYSALETTFNELKGKFNAHTHTGVSTGGGVSGTTATPSTADITAAKVEEILIP